jgi:hypothetical protein
VLAVQRHAEPITPAVTGICSPVADPEIRTAPVESTAKPETVAEPALQFVQGGFGPPSRVDHRMRSPAEEIAVTKAGIAPVGGRVWNAPAVRGKLPSAVRPPI